MPLVDAIDRSGWIAGVGALLLARFVVSGVVPMLHSAWATPSLW